MSRRNRRRRSKATRTQNASLVSSGGAGQAQDQGIRQVLSSGTLNPLDRSRSNILQAREWASWYYHDWCAKKLVNIPVEDMLREPWEYEGLDDNQTKTLRDHLEALGFDKSLEQALRQERLWGGSVILMGVASDSDDVEKPLRVEDVRPGDLKFTNTVARSRISSAEFNFDPLKPNFGRPSKYHIAGQVVHASRLLIFDGEPLTDGNGSDLGMVGYTRDGFGVSILAPIYDDLVRATGSRQGAMQLIQRASVLLIKNGGLGGMLETDKGASSLNKLAEIADQMSLYQAAMVEGKDVDLDQWSATFGSVPELLIQFLQIISAAGDVPATRFLSQAPGGLNATGDSDLENYYNMIDSRRKSRLRPQLRKLLPIALRSAGIDVSPADIEITFPPLWNLSETELATVRQLDTTNVVAMYQADLISRDEARVMLSSRGVSEEELPPEPLLDEGDRPDDPPDLETELGALESAGNT